MTIVNDSSMPRHPSGLGPEEVAGIRQFLQGEVYCWINNKGGEGFAARDLVGGAVADWTGTPLLALYNKHINAGKPVPQAVKDAGKDLGWILKGVLQEDKHKFESYDAGMAKGYKLVP